MEVIKLVLANHSVLSLRNSREVALLEGGGKIMKHVKYRSLAEVDEEKIVALLKVVK